MRAKPPGPIPPAGACGAAGNSETHVRVPPSAAATPILELWRSACRYADRRPKLPQAPAGLPAAPCQASLASSFALLFVRTHLTRSRTTQSLMHSGETPPVPHQSPSCRRRLPASYRHRADSQAAQPADARPLRPDAPAANQIVGSNRSSFLLKPKFSGQVYPLPTSSPSPTIQGCAPQIVLITRPHYSALHFP